MNKVFKHRVFNEHTLSILCNAELWFSSPKLFNDPFDGQLNVEILLETEIHPLPSEETLYQQ